MIHTALLLMGSSQGGGGWINLVFLGAIFVIFYFFIIRPQKKRQEEVQNMVDNLEKGDKIVTSGGMIARVRTVDEDTVLAEIDSDVKARFQKSSITDVNPNQD
ncbi:protein translocase subunit yajC [Fodinibius salinus]|uniref:Sec translocon accessory complex subunit YajC n=1 Tax=Fodinibius salinus TaxID=860790 RepID=A0A5D3YK81_9BACT|nr:preprotein translocase subunit YajC [Fodinibius salinus]TYP93366.1 protein translocase subunit yajC [Fodinibius salinus]